MILSASIQKLFRAAGFPSLILAENIPYFCLKLFPEFGARADERIANLNKLIERAGRSGLKVFLYVNEPRSQPAAFFARWPELRGAEWRGLYAMCTSQQPVRQWISDSLAHVLERAPDLGAAQGARGRGQAHGAPG